MKITRVHIQEAGDDGLKDIVMEKISSIVILAGKNGAGKTRLLNKIKKYLISSGPMGNSLESRKNQLQHKQMRINGLEHQISQFNA
ncbi:MAG: hypothetical protein ACM3MI_13815, partial [Clostridiales bacterium]